MLDDLISWMLSKWTDFYELVFLTGSRWFHLETFCSTAVSMFVSGDTDHTESGASLPGTRDINLIGFYTREWVYM